MQGRPKPLPRDRPPDLLRKQGSGRPAAQTSFARPAGRLRLGSRPGCKAWLASRPIRARQGSRRPARDARAVRRAGLGGGRRRASGAVISPRQCGLPVSMSSLAGARLAAPSVDCCFAGVVGVWNLAGGRSCACPAATSGLPRLHDVEHRSALAQRGTDRACRLGVRPWSAGRTARRRAPKRHRRLFPRSAPLGLWSRSTAPG